MLQKCFQTFKNSILWNVIVEGEGQGRGELYTVACAAGNTAFAQGPAVLPLGWGFAESVGAAMNTPVFLPRKSEV